MEDVNVGEYYGILSSCKRGAEVMGLNKKFTEPLISSINLWLNIEREKGTRPWFSMFEHYADVVLIMETTLQFSRTML